MITAIEISVTSFLAILFPSVVAVLSIVGGFCDVWIAYFIPCNSIKKICRYHLCYVKKRVNIYLANDTLNSFLCLCRINWVNVSYSDIITV